MSRVMLARDAPQLSHTKVTISGEETAWGGEAYAGSSTFCGVYANAWNELCSRGSLLNAVEFPPDVVVPFDPLASVFDFPLFRPTVNPTPRPTARATTANSPRPRIHHRFHPLRPRSGVIPPAKPTGTPSFPLLSAIRAALLPCGSPETAPAHSLPSNSPSSSDAGAAVYIPVPDPAVLHRGLLISTNDP